MNIELNYTLRQLADAWCERRALRALQQYLPGYFAMNGNEEDWGRLEAALTEVLVFAKAELTDLEIQIVEKLNHRAKRMREVLSFSSEEDDQEKAKLAGLEAPDLVMESLRNEGNFFKNVILELEKRPPNRAAAELVINAYQRGDAPPWLAAVLLGACRDPMGYPTVREILLAAPGFDAEEYAGVAMAKIGGPNALEDLIHTVHNAPDHRSRKGAACGLGEIFVPEAASALLAATLSGKISVLQGGWILGDKFPDERMVIELLSVPDRLRIKLATEIMAACIACMPIGPAAHRAPALVSKSSPALVEAIARVLADPNTTISPNKRKIILSWLDYIRFCGKFSVLS